MTDAMNRRRFLQVLGVSGGGAAVLSGCGIGPEPAEKLIPYLVPPEDQIPGTPTWYASTCRECPAGCGIRVKVREGRAIKIEGNPDSPINQGRLCARGQAALQGLYNPDRLLGPMRRNAQGQLEPTTWDDGIALLQSRVAEAAGAGNGIVFVTGTESASFGALVDDWTRQAGGRHLSYEPFAFEALREGNRLAFGDATVPWYDFAGARYILSFGADFMETWLSPVGFQNGFSRAHAFEGGEAASLAKFVYVGPRLAQTGLIADQWLTVAPGSEGVLALAMAQVIVSNRIGAVPADAGRLSLPTPEAAAPIVGLDAASIERLAREFAESGGGLAVAGGIATHYANGAEIVGAVNILNYVAGMVGKTVRFGADLTAGSAGSFRDMTALIGDMASGKVGVLLVHGANPVHSLGGFAQAWSRVAFKVSFSSYPDETAAGADLVLPDLHPLEQWNDSRPRAGVYALQQPVMQPVFSGPRATGDVLLRLAGKPGTFKDHLRSAWTALQQRFARGTAFEDWWTESLQHGGIYQQSPTRPARLAPAAAGLAATAGSWTPATPGGGELTAIVFPHPVLHDGRGANKPWLQELPDPVSKITWHGWVEVHPETAAQWQLASGDFLTVKSSAGAVTAPVWITPSVRRGVAALPTGQGHTAYGRYAGGRSFNAFDLLSMEPNAYGGRTHVVPVTVAKTADHRRLATTEGNAREQGARVLHVLTVEEASELRAGELDHEEIPEYAHSALEGWAEAQREKASLGDYAGDHPRWAMAIDLSRCTGCAACVTACYAENNIATVGEELVRRGREMSWMRIERYWRGRPDAPSGASLTPMLCQHCGNAPCEPVCPVYAAYHTPDGLNAQVYNRCVGTRYCANNCPYKVRYFNWHDYAEAGGIWEAFPEPLTWQLNPDVTVREKGVMEKCTFCVQRIRAAQNQARLDARPVADGEIVPACAQTCPSEAIVFGDLNDPASRVHALAQSPRGYHVLAGLNTKPGITYLARVVAGAE